MKIIISLAILVSLFVGCTDQSTLVSPDQSVQEPNWIKIPASETSGLQLNTDWTISKYIIGSQGGFIEYGVTSGNISIHSRIDFSSGSFSGRRLISKTLSVLNTSVEFAPSLVFYSDVHYNVTYSGLNLNGIDLSKIKFAYIGADGSIQIAEHEGITFNTATGRLSVKNARIPHFSRYGFVN